MMLMWDNENEDNIIVHVPELWMAEQLGKWAESNNLVKKLIGTSYANMWEEYKSDTCFRLSKKQKAVFFGSLIFYKTKGLNVVDFKDTLVLNEEIREFDNELEMDNFIKSL